MASGRDRVRKSRELARQGKTRVPVILDDQDDIDGVLVTAGFLDPALADDKAAIADALRRLLRTLRVTPSLLGRR